VIEYDGLVVPAFISIEPIVIRSGGSCASECKDPTGGSTDKDAQAGSTVKAAITFRCSTIRAAIRGCVSRLDCFGYLFERGNK